MKASRGDDQILAGFHPEPGNYEIYFPQDVELIQGEAWQFFCPVCHADLATEDNENLCALVCVAQGEEKRILFSRVAGEQATFVVSGKGDTESLGNDAADYFEFAMSFRM